MVKKQEAIIPKKIHYFWFGKKPLPKLAKKCIASWKKYFPDYEIKRWDESNFDVNIIPYTREAYKVGKYAFVADYARLKVLYEEGGLYFDTDVEVIRSFKDIVKEGAFMGFESTEVGGVVVNIGSGSGVPAKLDIIKEMMGEYNKDKFLLDNGKQNLITIVTRVTNVLVKHGLVLKNKIQQIRGVTIYPVEYFCPKDFTTGKLTITENTHSIHWYDSSWLPFYVKIYYKLTRFMPLSTRSFIKNLVRSIKN
ncbi:MAG: glycosyltransferase family 32 protein [Candidatus Nanosyncoccaceae bacterium]|jgi:hypothetical protein